MAAQAQLTLNTRIFVPRGTKEGISTWAYTPDVSFGNGVSVVRGSLSEGKVVDRVKLKLDIPNLATADSACGCAGTELNRGFFSAEFVFPPQWTSAQRDELTKRAKDLLASAIVSAYVKDLEPVW